MNIPIDKYKLNHGTFIDISIGYIKRIKVINNKIKKQILFNSLNIFST